MFHYLIIYYYAACYIETVEMELAVRLAMWRMIPLVCTYLYTLCIKSPLGVQLRWC